MALDIDQIINDFLRDAQYRVGELTIQMDEMDDAGIKSKKYKEKHNLRTEIIMLMEIVWWSYDELTDGYNFIYADSSSSDRPGNNWTERSLILEIEHMRDKAKINNVPYLSFVNYSTELVTAGLSQQGYGLPIGTYNQMIVYNISGDPIAVDFPVTGGMNTYEDINSYFATRE